MAKLRANKAAKQRVEEMSERLKREFEAVGLQREAADLPSSADIETRHAQRAQADGARRVDAFDALKPGMAIGAYDAVRRLEADFLIRRGEAGGPEIFGSPHNPDAPGEAERRLMAADRIKAVLGQVGDRDGWLLSDLIERRVYPDFIQRDDKGRETGRLTGWRAVVAHITGETNAMAQGAIVRHVCANLAAAYRHKRAA